MAVCEKHGEIITHPLGCTRCQWADSEKRKAQKKAVSKSGFYESKPSVLKSLKEKAQRELRKVVLALYCKGKVFTNCWTCGKPVKVKGTSVVDSIHVGHYFPKGVYWSLAYDLENCGLQCYDCNCNKEGVIPAMRITLVSVHGEEKIKALELRADEFMKLKKIGFHKNQPDPFWIELMIKKLKEAALEREGCL